MYFLKLSAAIEKATWKRERGGGGGGGGGIHVRTCGVCKWGGGGGDPSGTSQNRRGGQLRYCLLLHPDSLPL